MKLRKLPELEQYLFFHPTQFGKENGLKKKAHGKVNARGLTGAEIAGRALRAGKLGVCCL
jgi:hypothetical protein